MTRIKAVCKDATHIAVIVLGSLLTASSLLAQDVDAGRKTFESRCAACHGADGNGGEIGPAIGLRLATRDDDQVIKLIHEGLPTRGMPPSPISDSELPGLLKFLRTIERQAAGKPVGRMRVQTTDGVKLDGEVLGEGFDDLQLRT